MNLSRSHVQSVIAKIRSFPIKVVVLERYLHMQGKKIWEGAGINYLLPKPVLPQYMRRCLYHLFETAESVESFQTDTESSDSNKSIKAASCRVLVAEDNLVNQMVVRSILIKLGHQCDIVENGQKAVKLATERNYDLIFMDMRMPVLDGVEATVKIRSHGQNTKTPIIAVTADAMKDSFEESRDAGMNDFLIKPIDRVSVAKMISTWAIN